MEGPVSFASRAFVFPDLTPGSVILPPASCLLSPVS